jgi:hypothetical protein
MKRTKSVTEQIAALDAEKDHVQIVYLTGAYEFPWEIQRSLEFALFRTFAVPSIAELLDRTGQFQKAGQKRYDDTSLLIAEISEHGYDSERGRAAIRRMNGLHRRFDISNDDYLYVLSTFIFEPIRWNPILAWRPSSDNEKRANYYFWREIGRRMNIRDIPDSLEAFEAFNIDYERRNFRRTPHTERVGRASLRTFTDWFPGFLHPLVRSAIYALMDDPLREAFGFPKMPRWYTALLKAGLRLRASIVRVLPKRRTPFSLTTLPNRTYPQGYNIDELGA